MRVLYFTRDYTPHDHRFLTSLAESGQDVHFLRLERRGMQLEDRSLPPSVDQVIWRGGRAPFQWRSLPGLLLSLRGVIRRLQPDVIQAGPIQTAGFIAALSGFHPLVITSWGSDLLRDADASRWNRWVTRYTLARATVFTGDCNTVREKAAEYGVPQDRMYIFPWGIDLGKFSPGPANGLRSRLGWQDQFVVLSLRSWEPVYGVDVMLRGFARAAAQEPRLRLLMLGGGSQAALVHQIIQQNQLENCVYLGGQVNQQDLPGLYRSADLYLSASHSDGSSVSLMEALGSGLPSLVTAIPSNREWVREGQEGWLFPDGDDAALADKLLQAARLPRESLAAVAQQARARAEERADWRVNFNVLLQAYAAARQFTNKN